MKENSRGNTPQKSDKREANSEEIQRLTQKKDVSVKINIFQNDSSKSSESNTRVSNQYKKRGSDGIIKFDQKSFLSPNMKSRRSSDNYASSCNSFMISNNDISILGGEYSDVSMVYGNDSHKNFLNNSLCQVDKKTFKNKYDISFDPKYNMVNDPHNQVVVTDKVLDNGVKEKVFKSGVIERVYPRIKKMVYFPDGYTVTFFANGNVIQVYPGKSKIVKYDKEKKTTKMVFSNGLVTIKDQATLVKFYKDGSQVIVHSNGVMKVIDPSSNMKIIQPDGSIKRVMTAVNKVPLQVYEKSVLYSDNPNNS